MCRPIWILAVCTCQRVFYAWNQFKCLNAISKGQFEICNGTIVWFTFYEHENNFTTLGQIYIHIELVSFFVIVHLFTVLINILKWVNLKTQSYSNCYDFHHLSRRLRVIGSDHLCPSSICYLFKQLLFWSILWTICTKYKIDENFVEVKTYVDQCGSQKGTIYVV